MTIKDEQRKEWREEWATVRRGRYANDRLEACLASKIRNTFPAGKSGDRMFVVFIGQELDGCRPETMLDKALAYDTVSEREWRRLGGWEGLTFLQSLTNEQRVRIHKIVRGEGPFSAATIRARAAQLGIKSPRAMTRTGHRPIDVVSRFLLGLFVEGTVTVLPPEVMAVLPVATQRMIEKAVAPRHLALA